MNRKQRRQTQKDKKKMSPEEQNLSEKIFLFNQLPDACTSCQKAFDKTNKRMVFLWTVVVRDKEKTVNLFCPGCIEETKEKLNGDNANL